ncbi:F-box/RNI-like superfamily protein [Rhynchospora pubera]|uniref:F-box/RNI-like superfamily protein n=1 Tax=Rhynchospora pubera TaxID=906938 RepID=A0AAV8ERG3_9POAL|nr:F-box/RNI-like superfamily protein [Rhynchospora pubera]
MIERRDTCKLLKMEGIGTSIDTISDLPDSVLHHIMSFLKTREAVQTCILAKRWKNLWRTLPYLHLNLNDFRLEKNNACSSLDSFENFTSNLLLLRDPTGLHTFQLNCPYRLSCDDQIMSGCALYALRCNARVLSLLLPKGAALQLCHSVFKCKSLEDLRFGHFDKVDEIKLVPRTITLPHLRRLHLETMHLDEDFMEKMFLRCPSLTDLHLAWCVLTNVRMIRSRNLKFLALDRCVFEVDMQLIDAPSLTKLCINGLEAMSHRIHITSMPSLLKAVVGYWSSQPRQSVVFPRFSNVQQLQLKGCTIEALLKRELPTCPIFHKLRRLYVEVNCRTGDLALTADFILRHCPKLKELVLSHGTDYCCECAKMAANVYRDGREQKLRTILLHGPMLFDKITVLHFNYCHKGRKTPEALKKLGIWEGIGATITSKILFF